MSKGRRSARSPPTLSVVCVEIRNVIMIPTAEQVECREKFETLQPLKINAYAGTGKSTTLVQISKSTKRRGTMLCFNKPTAEDAKRKFPTNVFCSTTHGLAFREMKGKYSIEKMTSSVNGTFLAYKLRPESIIVGGINLSPRKVGFLINETVKRFERSSRPEMSKYDVAVIGILETLDKKYIDQYREWLFPQAVVAWEMMKDTASDIPLGHDGYLKVYCETKPTIPGDYILLDEAQDTNGVVLGLLSHQRAQCCAVGDRHQCQPAGTMVKRVVKKSGGGRSGPAVHEWVPIENINEGDRVVSWAMDHSHFYFDGDVVEGVSAREYSGDIIVASAGGKTSRYTPNHKCIVKLSNGFSGKHFVYLMQKGESFRIGKATGVLDSQYGRFGVSHRLVAEKPDAYWILSSHDTDEDARLAELTLSLTFGIPGLMFIANFTRVRQSYLDKFWATFKCDRSKVLELLRMHGRDINYPLWKRGEGNLIARRAATIHACNLMDGMQLLNSEVGTSKGKRDWITASFVREKYQGNVYSLKVANHETYMADGLVTHNSIYAWRGASNAMNDLPYETEARLSTSFRFGQGIAANASRILKLLGEEIPLTGLTGRVGGVRHVSNPRAILCRTNGQVIAELAKAIEGNLTPCVVGGTAEAIAWIDGAEKLIGGRPVEFPLDLFGFESWGDVKDHAGKDEGADIRMWVNLIEKYGTVELRRLLHGLPKDEMDADVSIATGHKAKGMEWETVRLAEDFLIGATESQVKPKNVADEELRLYYVAATRAKEWIDIPERLQLKFESVSIARKIDVGDRGVACPSSPSSVDQAPSHFNESLFSPA